MFISNVNTASEVTNGNRKGGLQKFILTKISEETRTAISHKF